MKYKFILFSPWLLKSPVSLSLLHSKPLINAKRPYDSLMQSSSESEAVGCSGKGLRNGSLDPSIA